MSIRGYDVGEATMRRMRHNGLDMATLLFRSARASVRSDEALGVLARLLFGHHDDQ